MASISSNAEWLSKAKSGAAEMRSMFNLGLRPEQAERRGLSSNPAATRLEVFGVEQIPNQLTIRRPTLDRHDGKPRRRRPRHAGA
jgi:hypothetical protein